MKHEQVRSMDLACNMALGEGSSSGGTNGCRFKGVVPQQNGHWGAQIYANHQRVWLGTFKTENDAAMAYDSAAIKLRSNDTYRNIKASPAMLATEANFQSHFSTDAVLIMIKDGSYQPKLAEYCRTCQSYSEFGPQPGVMRPAPWDGIVYTEHFEKELTPSDVGKLNRLVIPKKYAVKFFPHVSQADPEIFGNGNFVDAGDAELDFYDTSMRRWTFRYCYWKSSQSFVFTKGWNKFVKEKGLKTKDVVLFYGCEMRPKHGANNEVRTFSMIDVRHYQPRAKVAPVAADADVEPRVVDEVARKQPIEAEEGDVNCGQEEEDVHVEQAERRGFRLFGVEIM